MMAPAYFQIVVENNLGAEVYNALNKEDAAKVVMLAQDILKRHNLMPSYARQLKSETKSTDYRKQGNTAYAAGTYQKAFEFYNKALLYAPIDSRAMKLIYSNRSALLLKTKCYEDALSDINRCFNMGCPPDIREKLLKRKADITSHINRCKAMLGPNWVSTIFSDFGFFKFEVTRNPQIPCANTDVGVIMVDKKPKIVATRDVKVGTLLAIESAYMSQTNKLHFLFSCYYCHKMSMNFIPCEKCCYALFCNEDCRAKASDEHDISCDVIEAVESPYASAMSILAIKSAFRMFKNKPLKEFIEASKNIGEERMKDCSINEIFDKNQPFSILNFKKLKEYPMGHLFSSAFHTSVILHVLETVSNVLPECPTEKREALDALARIILPLTVFSIPTKMTPAVNLTVEGLPKGYNISNGGFYSFMGKLTNDCNPNCITISLHKEIALIALKPIPRGTPLTISYAGHWLNGPFDRTARAKSLFIAYGISCRCFICKGEWRNVHSQLTVAQKRYFDRLAIRETNDGPMQTFSKVTKVLTSLCDTQFSKEYEAAYREFRRLLQYFQHANTMNIIVSNKK